MWNSKRKENPMSEEKAHYGKEIIMKFLPEIFLHVPGTQQKGRTLMEIFGEEAEIKKRKLDQDLTWEIGRNEHAKHDLKLLLDEIVCGWEDCEHKTIITSELKSIISCLEKPRPKD
jgi:hypothetical protein